MSRRGIAGRVETGPRYRKKLMLWLHYKLWEAGLGKAEGYSALLLLESARVWTLFSPPLAEKKKLLWLVSNALSFLLLHMIFELQSTTSSLLCLALRASRGDFVAETFWHSVHLHDSCI
ncbi:uncharacterized protein LOC119981641 isoform X1 [Tripterygium wilfordii]|uniref:uncharacterized protein LOC119981641 isoform X1 n=1 Tax=Tripterygium wilfordii TaxID=458696 RepID=UPI0018F7EC77|nr:uncharacterized protein LOC119981641 isoform X1 [Tripterygium wilfordii]